MPAFDNAATAQTSVDTNSFSFSYTCSGANRFLLVGVKADFSDTVTGVTYAGVSMVEIPMTRIDIGRWVRCFGLMNPAVGANNVIVSASSVTFMDVVVASWTSVKQSGQPEASNVVNVPGGTSIDASVTTLTTHALAVSYVAGGPGLADAGTGTVRIFGDGIGHAIMDNLAHIGAPGTYANQMSFSSGNVQSVTASLAGVRSYFLMRG